jgi:hypothetical protein
VPVTSTSWPSTKWSACIVGAHFDEVVSVDAELDDLALRLDLGDRELAALRLGGVLRLDGAGTELEAV